MLLRVAHFVPVKYMLQSFSAVLTRQLQSASLGFFVGCGCVPSFKNMDGLTFLSALVF